MKMPSPDLVALSDTRKVVEPRTEDVRGRAVVDTRGDRVGTVRDLLLDSNRTRVRYLTVTSGGFLGFGRQTLYIPVSVIAEIGEAVRLDIRQTRGLRPPAYDPAVRDASYTL